jgi:hypothetical protein
MIIELFGPPGAGKTTFARNLAAQLREQGRSVELIVSSRPSEVPDSTTARWSALAPIAAVRRLTRPAMEFLAHLRQRRSGPGTASIASPLLELLPPANYVWALRLRQYIRRLENSWRLAEQSKSTVIIDQGFVQAVCSLTLLCGAPALGAIETALGLIPKADYWIRMDAPAHLLRDRLEVRRLRQSRLERQFELDTATSLRSIEILDLLDPFLRRRQTRLVRLGPGENWLPPEAKVESAATAAPAKTLGVSARPQLS